MFRKTILSAATVLVAASLIWAANDPWKSKPYDQWDDKDIHRIFNDSPWSKVVQIGTSSPSPSGMPADTSAASPGQQTRGMGGEEDNTASPPLPRKLRSHLQPARRPSLFAGFHRERFAKPRYATQF